MINEDSTEIQVAAANGAVGILTEALAAVWAKLTLIEVIH